MRVHPCIAPALEYLDGRTVYAGETAIRFLLLRNTTPHRQYTCLKPGISYGKIARSARPAHPGGVAGGRTHFQPGAGQARGPVPGALLATAETARKRRIRGAIRHPAGRPFGRVTDRGLCAGVVGEPSSGQRPPVRSVRG